MMNVNDKYEMTEGDTVIHYTVTEPHAGADSKIADVAEKLVQHLVDASPFSGSDFSENAARAEEY